MFHPTLRGICLASVSALLLIGCGGTNSSGSSSSSSSSSSSTSSSSSSTSSSSSSSSGSGSSSSSSSSSSGSASKYCPSNEACKILPLGDSITDGVGVTGGGGYRIELFRLAVEAGLDITFVGGSQNGPTTLPGTSIPFPRAHEGHSGQTIQWILDNRIKQGALNVKPHIILLHIGTNDMWAGPSGAPTRLGTLIDEITTREPNALLVVSNIIPWPADPDVGPYNAQIPNVVEQRRLQGKNVLFVDQFTGFPTSGANTGLATDGIHPNANGYKIMGGKWFNAIYEYLVDID